MRLDRHEVVRKRSSGVLREVEMVKVREMMSRWGQCRWNNEGLPFGL